MTLLFVLIKVYTYVVLAAVVMSWIPNMRDNAVGRFIESVTEPVFAQVRKVVPAIGGLDLSPLIVLLALGAVSRMLLR